MSNSVLKNTVYAVKEETTEGTYAPPTLPSDYVQVIPDGTEMNPTKESISRSILTGSVGMSTPRSGIRSVAGALNVEMRASDAEGGTPEWNSLMKSVLGATRNQASLTIDSSENTASNANSTTRFLLADADGDRVYVGDIVTIKVAGAYHTSPVIAVGGDAGNVYADLLIAAPNAFIDGQQLMAFRTYLTAESGHPSLSISKRVETTRKEVATGCKMSSLSLDGFSTGQLASFNFSFDGMDFEHSIVNEVLNPEYQEVLPPIILGACIWQNGTKIPVNEVTLSVENTLAFTTSTCSPNGRISSRVTERQVSGSINPYKQNDSVDQFDMFNSDEEFSLFGFAKIPTGVDGEYKQAIGFYMPNCKITELAEANQDGLLQETLNFSATRGNTGLEEEIFFGVN